MTVQCCVCKRERIDGAWRPKAEESPVKTSHTYCPACLAKVRAEILSNLKDTSGHLASCAHVDVGDPKLCP